MAERRIAISRARHEEERVLARIWELLDGPEHHERRRAAAARVIARLGSETVRELDLIDPATGYLRGDQTGSDD